MASKYWIKLYIEILDDPKMGTMSDRLWRRTIEMFLLAGELDQDGLLPDISDIAWRLRTNEASLKEDLTALASCDIVHQDDNGLVVAKFAERQAPTETAKRVRLFRDRKQKDQYYGDNPLDIEEKGFTVDKEEVQLVDAFCKITSIDMPANPSVYAKWLTQVNEWQKIGVTIADIASAYETASEKNMTISRPQSLTNFIRSAISYRNRDLNKAKQSDLDMDKLVKEVFDD